MTPVVPSLKGGSGEQGRGGGEVVGVHKLTWGAAGKVKLYPEEVIAEGHGAG